jgi:hypothetical protein
MILKDAVEFTERIGIQILEDKNLNLIAIILDDYVYYLHPEDFKKFDVPEFKTYLAQRLIHYNATRTTNPRFH